MKSTIAAFMLLSTMSFAQDSVSGFVYEDSNKNAVKDRKEKGIENVAVSNGIEVVLTDKDGKYSLPLYGDNLVFVVKPSGYQTKINEKFLPEFYYNFKPNGSPSDFKYKGVSPTGKLPKSVDFPLTKQNEEKDFQILVFGDPQPYSLQEIDYFRRGIINEVKGNKKQAILGISLGDLVGDDLSLHQPYIEAVKELGLPWYNVMGNHDMNYDAKEDKNSDETFEANFGPSNYSFNYGNVHFIILDDILYPDPRDGKGYWGGFREDQLKFVENDLKLVDKNKLIVVSFHIQLKEENAGDAHFREEDRNHLFSLLQPFENVLLMSAHTHKQTQIFHAVKSADGKSREIHEINMGTTSGDWYSGEPDALGVPASTMRDGTYRGYSFINFKDNQYQIQYKVAGRPEDFMINLHIPEVIPFDSKNSARIFANFFVGSEKDVVEYRIDNAEWKKMTFAKTIDPKYAVSVFKWDTTKDLFEGRRPSNPDQSNHVWSAGFGKNLGLGKHKVEVRATDQYGKMYTASEEFEVKNAKIIR